MNNTIFNYTSNDLTQSIERTNRFDGYREKVCVVHVIFVMYMLYVEHSLNPFIFTSYTYFVLLINNYGIQFIFLPSSFI